MLFPAKKATKPLKLSSEFEVKKKVSLM